MLYVPILTQAQVRWLINTYVLVKKLCNAFNGTNLQKSRRTTTLHLSFSQVTMKISARLSEVLLFNVITATVSGKPFLDAQQQACAPRLQALDAVKLSNGVCECLLISLLEGISKTLRETEVQVSASGCTALARLLFKPAVLPLAQHVLQRSSQSMPLQVTRASSSEQAGSTPSSTLSTWKKVMSIRVSP